MMTKCFGTVADNEAGQLLVERLSKFGYVADVDCLNISVVVEGSAERHPTLIEIFNELPDHIVIQSN